MNVPPRTDLDLEVDRLFHCMVNAETGESKLLWGQRFTAAVNRRNAERTAKEIAELERAKGLAS